MEELLKLLPADPFVIAVIILAIALTVIFVLVGSSKSKRVANERLKAMQAEAQRFFRDLAARKTLPTAPVGIILKEGELGVFREPSVLHETRAYRLYGGAGTRIRGIYVGGGASESHQRVRQIDSGALILTNLRLVFDGQSENRTTNLKDIISASPWQDAIEVSSGKRQKSQVYTVGNPIIWAQVIQMLASGQVETVRKNT